MFLGHFAAGFGAKRLAPEVSLGTLIFGAQFADLLWPLLVLAGVERFEIAPGITGITPIDFVHYPWSHSLVMLLVWGGIVAVIHRLVRKTRWKGSLVLAGAVVSHWILDFIVHRPDMPLLPGGERFGLAIWNSIPATLAIELLLFAAGVWVYVTSTAPRDRIGTWSLAGLVVFLLLIQIANVFSPPPPSVDAVAYTALAMWIFVAWGAWIDRHRTPRVRG